MSAALAEPRYVGPPAGDRATKPRLNQLYRVGGIAAAAAAFLTPISVGVFAMWPPPGYEEGARVWFELIQNNKMLGLLSLDLPFLIITALMVPVMLALFVALREVRPAHIAIAGVLFLVAVATYFGTNTSIEMLSFSYRYAAAATEAQRVSLLGAGEMALAAFNSTAFHVNYILAQIAGILFGLVMLRTQLFSRAIAYLMIGGNAFGFLLYVPEVGVALSAISGVILWLWMILVSRRLLQLARSEI
jgi:hypothetical protein